MSFDPVSFDLTRGEIILVAFIFALVYLSGLLPKIAARFSGASGASGASAANAPAETDAKKVEGE